MHKTKIILLILIGLLLISSCALAEDNTQLSKEGVILKQLDKLDLSSLQKEVTKINSRIDNILPELSFKNLLLNFVRGDLEFSWLNILRSLLKYLGKEVTANLYIMGQILILAVISAILRIFHDSFSSKTISKTANILIFLILAVLLLQSFKLAIGIGIDTVNYMTSFMQALVPILLTLLVSMAAITSAAVFHPITYLIISLLTIVIKNVIFPMIFISVVLNIVDNIADDFKISRLSGLFKEFSIGLLGLMLMIFIGGLLLNGGAAALTDSLSLRTAKYLTGTFIPVIGGIFSDAVDLIVSCSLIIKNALNFFGVLAILLIIAYPVIKIAALILVYKVSGAILQPISTEKIVDIINNLANSLILVFAVVLTVAFMFFIVITVLVGTANLTVIMR